jgi:undecaprenyl-diphosphatase
MNSFDSSIVSFFNDFAQRWHALDETMVFLSESSFMKGGLALALLWWLWFRKPADGPDRRDYVLSALVACVAAVLIARLLAVSLPFRERPMVASAQHFVLPYGSDAGDLAGWSAFPSDHAVLFFALAMGVFQAHRRFGTVAFLWAAVVVCFPRVYLGIHWPTDILAGAALGVGVAWLVARQTIRDAIARPALRLLDRYPGAFYAAMFLATFEIVNLFGDLREAGHLAADILGGLV